MPRTFQNSACLVVAVCVLLTMTCALRSTESRVVEVTVVDSEGSPLKGAALGQLLFNTGNDQADPQVKLSLFGEEYSRSGNAFDTPETDGRGRVKISRDRLFWRGDARKRMLIATTADHGLMGFCTLDPKRTPYQVTIQLQPTISTQILPQHERLTEDGQSRDWSALYVRLQDQTVYELVSSTGSHQFRLPAGDYQLTTYGVETNQTRFDLHVSPELQGIQKTVDLTPTQLKLLEGHPAPELTQIKDWYQGEPTTIRDLRGNVVLLDFWGYWCNPCVARMPKLFDLLEEYADEGLVIIGIHDDSVSDAKELHKKLKVIREKLWNGKPLPFPIAIDGGGETPVQGRHNPVRGATTAAYGIPSWPTYVLIDRQGRIAKTRFYPDKPEHIELLTDLLVDH